MTKYILILLLLFTVNSYAQTVIFEDAFTDTNDTPLTSHTPSPTGTGWTEEFAFSNVGEIGINRARPNVNQTNTKMTYTALPNPSVVEYDVQAQYVTTGNPGITSYAGLFGRFTDDNNHYSLGWLDDNGQVMRLFKKVATVRTSLGTGGAINAGEVLKLEIRDAAKKAYEDGVEKISSTDNVLTSAGKAGLWWGDVQATGDDIDTDMTFDNFKVTIIVAARRVMIISYLWNLLFPDSVGQERVRDGIWYISPVITERGVRMPKIETVIDPGQPLLFNEDTGQFDIPQYCRTSNTIGNSDISNEWALSYVRCADYSALDADPEIIKMYNETDGVDLRLNQLSSTDRNSLRTKVNTRKTRNSTLTNSDTVRKWIEDLGKEINPQFNVDGTYVR
jgi:hypothetical protein